MKEQILRVERTDDFSSLRDKVMRAQAGRLFLLWPVLEKPLHRRLEIALLREGARAAGIRLILISSDPDLIRLAVPLGLTVHPTLAAAGAANARSETEWRRTGREAYAPRRMPLPRPIRRTPQSIGKAARILLVAAAVFSLAAVPLLLFPAARVEAAFPSRTVRAEFGLDRARTIPLTIAAQASGRRVSSGSRVVPTAHAAGFAAFTNIGTLAVNLPAGVRVMAESGASFETTDGMALAPGSSRTLPIRAVFPGPEGNVPAGAIRVVTGSLSLTLAVNNPTATTGGAERRRSAIVAGDLASLRADLEAEILARAPADMATAAGTAAMVAEDGIRIEYAPDDLPDNPADAAADTVGLTVHAVLRGSAYPAALARALAEKALRAELADGERLLPGSMRLELRTGEDGALRIESEGLAVRAPTEADLAAELRGRPAATVVAYLGDRYGASARVVTDPAWLPLLPIFSFRIQAEISADGVES